MNSSTKQHDSLEARISNYCDTLEHNDTVHLEFTRLVETLPFLLRHRRHIEANRLGFGDAAFHYLWYLIIQQIAAKCDQPKLLEIGVYKGQVISLWQLLAAELQLNLDISAISPLEGNPLPQSPWVRRWQQLVKPALRWDIDAGNIYPDDDYRLCIEQLFREFHLDLSKIQLTQGYSNDSAIIETYRDRSFSLIYIDGDHTYEGVKSDIENYAPLVEEHGFLVMDDASYYRPGSVFWKGHEPVSRACELLLPMMGFANVLNVGHNRVYQRVR